MTGTSLKLRTWWRREELDERLAHGADPESDPMLSRRAAQLTLAERLRDDKPIDVQGAAMSARIVFDGSSPAYREGAVTLRHALRPARLALDPVEEVIETELPRVA